MWPLSTPPLILLDHSIVSYFSKLVFFNTPLTGDITMEVIGSVEIYENARMMFRMFSTDVFSQCLA